MEDGKGEYIESISNVHFLKTDPKARYQGYTFYFKEGFCWNNVLTTFIRCRIKQKTVQSTESMSFFSVHECVPEYFLISVMNSYFAAYYIDSFINSTSHCTTGDAKIIPIIIPSKEQLSFCKSLFDTVVSLKKTESEYSAESEAIIKKISSMENKIDNFISELYAI